MIFVPLFHPSRTAAAALPILGFFSVLRPLSANIRNEPRGLRLARLFFYFKTSLALSRNFLKFPIYLRPTRVNFSTASSTTLPHPEEGAALLRGRLSPSFSVFPFRPGNLGLFGALLQPPAPEKKIFLSSRLPWFRLHSRALKKATGEWTPRGAKSTTRRDASRGLKLSAD